MRSKNTMLVLDIRKLIRNQFRLSKPCCDRYVFKKRISPMAGKLAKIYKI